jgi:hypothetical protein
LRIFAQVVTLYKKLILADVMSIIVLLTALFSRAHYSALSEIAIDSAIAAISVYIYILFS